MRQGDIEVNRVVELLATRDLMLDESVEGFAGSVCVQSHLNAHDLEADRLRIDVTSAPNGCDIDVGLNVGRARAILATPMLAITKIICDRIRPLMAFGHFIEG